MASASLERTTMSVREWQTSGLCPFLRTMGIMRPMFHLPLPLGYSSVWCNDCTNYGSQWGIRLQIYGLAYVEIEIRDKQWCKICKTPIQFLFSIPNAPPVKVRLTVNTRNVLHGRDLKGFYWGGSDADVMGLWVDTPRLKREKTMKKPGPWADKGINHKSFL